MVSQPVLDQIVVEAPAGRQPAVLVELQGAVRRTGRRPVDQHIARPSVKGLNRSIRSRRRQKGDVADTADILNRPTSSQTCRGPQKKSVKDRYERGALSPSSHIGYAKIGNGCDSGPLRDDRRLSNLERRLDRTALLNFMPHGLPVRTDQIDLSIAQATNVDYA